MYDEKFSQLLIPQQKWQTAGRIIVLLKSRTLFAGMRMAHRVIYALNNKSNLLKISLKKNALCYWSARWYEDESSMTSLHKIILKKCRNKLVAIMLLFMERSTCWLAACLATRRINSHSTELSFLVGTCLFDDLF